MIVVFYRRSDESFYWKEVSRELELSERRLLINKSLDVLDSTTVNRLAGLTVPKAGFGYYVPALGGGEEAIVNILPITLPHEIFVASTPYDGKKASAILLDGDEGRRAHSLTAYSVCAAHISRLSKHEGRSCAMMKARHHVFDITHS